MMESGSTIKLRGKESTYIKMELPILESGRTISSMAMVRKNGQTEPGTKAAFLKASRKATAGLSGETTASTKENSKTTISRGSVTISGLTQGNTKASGRTTKCTESGILSGPTEENTKDHTSTIGKKAKESSPGQTEGATREAGRTENRTVEESTSIKPGSKNMELGPMERSSNGTIDVILNIQNIIDFLNHKVIHFIQFT